jgi:glyoxylase-like metal-dependent hydrolase (beta-lactamase superfamily II)
MMLIAGWVGAVVVVLLMAGMALFLSAFWGRRAIGDQLDVEGIRIVKDSIVSACLIPVEGHKVVLVDACNDHSGKAILAELSRSGLTPDAVQAILLTHGHRDHIGAVNLFPNAQVMCLAPEVDLVAGRTSGRGPLLRFFPFKPTGIKVTRTLHDGETVVFDNLAIRVYALPGHTLGSAAYLARGVLMIGDSADIGRDGKLRGAPWLFSDDAALNRQSLAELGPRLSRENVVVKAIICAHSGANRWQETIFPISKT